MNYRFVSNPDVVLQTYENPNGGTYWATKERYLTEFGPEQCDVLIKMGIIKPVPVEIPEHVVEAARKAYWAIIDRGGSSMESLHAALIAAKEAEEAGT